MSDETTKIFFYEAEIPDFVEEELDLLYGVSYSSLKHLRVYGKLDDARTYICFENDKPITILLFKIEKQRVLVLNEVIRLTDDEIQKFSREIFSRYPEIRTITFTAIEKHARHLSLPSHAVFYHHDTWLSVPGSAEEYLKGLRRNTRQAIKQELRTLKSSIPSFNCQYVETNDIREQDIRTIIGFNQLKLKGKGIISSVDETETNRIIVLSRECGIACIAKIDERVCGGVIGYRFGKNFSFHVTGYDQTYEEYRIGFLTYYLSICECIARNAKDIHLGWGNQTYKARLGGVSRDLERLIIFRSWAYFFLGWQEVMQTTLKSNMIKSRDLIKAKAANHEGMASTFARGFIGLVRLLRHRH